MACQILGKTNFGNQPISPKMSTEKTIKIKGTIPDLVNVKLC